MSNRLAFRINSIDWIHYIVLFIFIIVISLPFNYFLIRSSNIFLSGDSASIYLFFNTSFSIFCPYRCQLWILTIYFIIELIIWLIILRIRWVRFIYTIIWSTCWIFNLSFTFAKLRAITPKTFFASIQKMPSWTVLINSCSIDANAFLLLIFMSQRFILKGSFKFLNWLLLSFCIALFETVFFMLTGLFILNWFHNTFFIFVIPNIFLYFWRDCS
jgi:hypothetical protein